MNVSLTPELESLVHEKVESGLYTSASEVVREALRLLNDKDAIQQQRLAELKREIAVGLEDLKLGKTVSGEQVFEELRQRNEAQPKPEIPVKSLAEMLAGRIGLFESDGPGYRAQQTEKTFADHVADKHRSGHL